MLDKQALLDYLRSHETHPKLAIYAIYAGLAERIERGDFDIREEE